MVPVRIHGRSGHVSIIHAGTPDVTASVKAQAEVAIKLAGKSGVMWWEPWHGCPTSRLITQVDGALDMLKVLCDSNMHWADDRRQ